VLFEKRRRAFGPIMRTAPQNHHHIGFHRSIVHTQTFLRKKKGGDTQQDQEGEKDKRQPQTPFSYSSHTG
jgi:hypothetical protein